MNDELTPAAGEEPCRPQDLRKRTRAFALAIVNFYSSLPTTTVAQVLGKQLLRCGTSAGAHYREGKRARSPAEFISKLEGALQELEESCYWLELLAQARIGSGDDARALHVEASQLIAIFVSSVRTVKAGAGKPRRKRPDPDADDE